MEVFATKKGATTAEEARRRLGEEAARRVVPGMRLGIGSGRTVLALLAALEPRIRAGLDVEAACASLQSADAARRIGIRVRPEAEVGPLDLAIDGTDVLTPSLDCIKGGGGAMTRERLVALGAPHFLVIAEEEKLREDLRGIAVPVEVLAFGHSDTARRLEGIGLAPRLRNAGGSTDRTDNGNLIYDCAVPATAPVKKTAARLDALPGVVAHGYFLGMAHEALIAGDTGVHRLVRGR